MKILVITSPNPIRQENIKKQFSSQNGNWQNSYEIVPAVMEKTARYGIAKSHKKCVQIAKDRGWPYVVIAEDDLDLISPDSLRTYFLNYFALPEDWDIYAGGLFSGEVIDTYLGYGMLRGAMSGFHFYMVNAKFYDTFLSASETMNIDYEITEILKAKVYVAYPIIVKEIAGYSYNAGEYKNYSEQLCKKYRCI